MSTVNAGREDREVAEKKQYVPPVIKTHTEQEILEQLGPAQGYSSCGNLTT